ncbi:inositol monophosphatase [Longibacter salinarum]|uniref:Inositol-1-monophosphatase n=1 Tax=Longibacter salinarum TaxID=1850348 RepID=A0A2A8CTF9_9BACT|nr:inositol monophosphatase family protein [Longibacter salinarum]PEN11100.1 inositol monophosphatase [Longibacter salinarum]
MPVPSHGSSYEDVLATAVRAAHNAAAVIREAAGTFDHPVEIDAVDIDNKGVNDFVTVTDRAAQDVIVEQLQQDTPGVEILAEEGDDPEELEWTGDRWIVDPIDGTTNFMHRLPPYAVSIAFQTEDRLRVGVVLDVSHDVLYTAVAGHGLQRNGRPDEVTFTDTFSDAFLATGFPYRRFEHTEIYLDILAHFIRSTQGLRRHGSAAIDCARTACGRFDGFYETGLKPWDVAAGTLLIREGGGRVTTYDGRDGLAPVYDRQICASNNSEAIHAGLLRGLEPMKDIRL